MNTISSYAAEALAPPAAAVRRIVHRTQGHRHGPITRLMSPSDLGQMLKPFVFLDIFASEDASRMGGFAMHPHSGIATLTYMLEGESSYEDSTGKQGILPSGGVEWMLAGGGVWHTGGPARPSPMRGFQLWVALPAAQENAAAQSLYLSPDELPQEGPARVLLGRYGAAQSAIASPSPMNYLAVHLKAGERWHYLPPQGHTVAWVAVGVGRVAAQAMLDAGDMVVFEESGEAIEFQAQSDTVFMLGSAVKHPHDLVMGSYSVHTSQEALHKGEAGIREIARRLRAEGRL